jgi:hypothetical protein
MESKRHVFMSRLLPFVGGEALEVYNSEALNAK